MRMGISNTLYAAGALLLMGSSLSGHACAAAAADKAASDADIAEVVVTGSLIPQDQVHLGAPTPVTVISPADIEARGFSNLTDALQHSSFATGSVQGLQ